MKKQHFIWLSTLFCLWFIEGCNDDNGKYSDTSFVEPLYLSALIDGMTADETSYRFKGGAEVGIWLSTTDVSGKLDNADVVRNMRFTQSAGGLVTEPRASWENHSTINVYAYAPYDEKAQDTPHAYPFQLNLRQDTVSLIPDGNRQSDFLWTKCTSTYTGEPLPLSFHHLMSKIIIHVKNYSSTPGNLIDGKLTVCNTQTAAKIDLGNGSVSPTGAKGSVVARNLQEIPGGYEISREVIIVPQTIHVGEKFLDILTSGDYSCIWYADKELVFESGKQITMEAVIKEQECHVRIKDISPWKESQNLITGDAVEDLPTFNLFDFYDRNGIKGIVVDVDETGTHGWIVSLNEANLKWRTSPMGYPFPSANSEDDAISNLKKVQAYDSTLNDYPALKWCNDMNKDGEIGWVLPAYNVLKKFVKLICDKENCDKLNQAIKDSGEDDYNLVNINWESQEEYYYASSTLSMTDNVKRVGVSLARQVIYGDAYDEDSVIGQNYESLVRAFREF